MGALPSIVTLILGIFVSSITNYQFFSGSTSGPKSSQTKQIPNQSSVQQRTAHQQTPSRRNYFGLIVFIIIFVITFVAVFVFYSNIASGPGVPLIAGVYLDKIAFPLFAASFVSVIISRFTNRRKK